jgi:hypothetical protein
MTLPRFLRFFLMTAAALVVLGTPTPTHAQDIGCPETLRECYARAAQRDSIWDMWVAGIECELDFVECVRRALMGR